MGDTPMIWLLSWIGVGTFWELIMVGERTGVSDAGIGRFSNFLKAEMLSARSRSIEYYCCESL